MHPENLTTGTVIPKFRKADPAGAMVAVYVWSWSLAFRQPKSAALGTSISKSSGIERHSP